MRLYVNALSGNSCKLRFLVSRLGLDCVFEEVDIFAGESRTEAFIERNPAGQTPVLELDDGTAIAESNAILCYLTEGSDLLPTEPVTRAQVLRWMFFEQNQVMPTIAWARFIRRFLPEDHPMRARLGWLEEGGQTALSVMERHLSQRAFFATDACTLADIALHGYGHLAPEAGIDLAAYPNVRAWLAAMRTEPGHTTLATHVEPTA